MFGAAVLVAGPEVGEPCPYPLDLLTVLACVLTTMVLACLSAEGGPVFLFLAVLCAAGGGILLLEEKKEK